MKKLKSISFSLFLVAILTLTMAPVTTVYADIGPQGGSNSAGPHPPPPPPPTSGGDSWAEWISWVFSQ